MTSPRTGADYTSSKSTTPARGDSPPDGATWSYHFRIADFAFELRGHDELSQRVAECLFAACVAEPAVGRLAFSMRCLDRARSIFALSCQGEELCRSDGVQSFFQDVEWWLTGEAMGQLNRYLQLHSGLAAIAGSGFALIGGHGAGKTSLSFGLYRSGAILYSDEVALVEPTTLRLAPFLRDLIIHDGTSRLLGTAAAAADLKIFDGYRYVTTELANSRAAIAGTAVLEHLVFPHFELGSETRIEAIGASEATRRLLVNAFNLEAFGAGTPDLLAHVAESCEAIEMKFGDARAAAECLLNLPL